MHPKLRAQSNPTPAVRAPGSSAYFQCPQHHTVPQTPKERTGLYRVKEQNTHTGPFTLIASVPLQFCTAGISPILRAGHCRQTFPGGCEHLLSQAAFSRRNTPQMITILGARPAQVEIEMPIDAKGSPHFDPQPKIYSWLLKSSEAACTHQRYLVSRGLPSSSIPSLDCYPTPTSRLRRCVLAMR